MKVQNSKIKNRAPQRRDKGEEDNKVIFVMQNLLAMIFLVFLFLSFVPQVQAASIPNSGLVPCGGCATYDENKVCTAKQPACGFCDVFGLTNNILQFILTRVLTSVAVLMFVIGGAYFLIAGSSPQLLTKGKTILTAAAIGLVIILASYVFMNTLFMYIGVAKWTGLTIVAEGKIETSKSDAIGLGSPGSLRDVSKDKPWNPNDFTGFPIMIRKGPGSPQTKIISGNTEDTINIEGQWVNPDNQYPNNGSEYSIGGKWFNVICK
ncbi:MAG: hypothetical protein Q7K28_03375 [Candidatus Wildermuthbacteria bacterium]|nr:hypothetical protein [Candidatus Wildermuthbacteria bacterium]